MNKEILGHSLEYLKTLEDESIDLILTDPPYNTTDCKWDKQPIDWNILKFEFMRIIKTTGTICVCVQNPFGFMVGELFSEIYRHRWIWCKDKSANFMVVSGQPLKYTEDIIVFSKRGHYKPANSKIDNAIYNPQTTIDIRRPRNPKHQPMKNIGASIGEIRKKQTEYLHKSNPEHDGKIRFPNELIYYPVPFKKERIHPTQKPVLLFEYLIKTYTNEGMTVLDCFAGSMTTAISCLNTDRKYICIEQEEEMFNKAKERIKKWHDDRASRLF